MNVADQRHQLIADIMKIRFLTLDAPSGISAQIGPCLFIDAVTAEQLDLSSFDLIGDSVDHAERFPVLMLPVLRREDQTQPGRMSIYADAHLPVQVMAVLTIYRSFMSLFSFCACTDTAAPFSGTHRMHQRAHDVRKRIAASLRMDPLMIYVQL